MIAKFMGCRPWPPVLTKKFKVNLKVQSLEGFSIVKRSDGEDGTTIMIKVKWCGPKKGALNYHLGRSQKRAQTSEKEVEEGIIKWQEEFEHLCVFTTTDQRSRFLPFILHFTIVQLGTKLKTTILGTASMNLGDLAPSTQAENMERTVKLDVLSPEGHQKQTATLVVTLSFFEDAPTTRLSLDCSRPSTLSCLSSAFLCDQQIRGMCDKKAKHLRKTISFSGKKITGELEHFACIGKPCEKSSSDVEEASDNDSAAGSEGVRVTEEENRRLQSYGSLTRVNLVVEGALPTLPEIRQDPLVTPNKTSRGAFISEASTSEADQNVHMRRLLSWKRRRKVRSLPERGEPLLRKAHDDTGGDDIDLDRHLSFTYPHDKSEAGDHALLSSEAMSKCLDCGEVQFSVGCWERKELVNRVGHMKLLTKVFFASIDQRSERAGGESACTALVVVIADWLHQNPNMMPIRAEFDTLIRQGSAEWRTLCDDEVYRKKFPDQHFDLETVLEAKIRPLELAEGGTSVGFFKPEVENSMFDFLHGAVLFDDIWEASIIEESLMLKLGGTFEPAVYIVSWNDHFFLLKVDREAYYIIDTLGERLYEGCKQAYMLCFDKETILTLQDKVMDGKKSPEKTPSLPIGANTGMSVTVPSNPVTLTTLQPDESPGSTHQHLNKTDQDDGISSQKVTNSEIKYKGRDACKEFIKGFFAALALKQLHEDIKKGVLGTSPLHRRLQIEFHRTCLNHSPSPLSLQGTMQHSCPPKGEEKGPSFQHAPTLCNA